MDTPKHAAVDNTAAADAPAADEERSPNHYDWVCATLPDMLTFGHFCTLMGRPEAVPDRGHDGGDGPLVSFHWFSAVPFDAEIDASEHLAAIPPRWAVSMEFGGDGAVRVGIEARNAEDLLDRLVGHCVRNGVPYRIEKPQPTPEEG